MKYYVTNKHGKVVEFRGDVRGPSLSLLDRFLGDTLKLSKKDRERAMEFVQMGQDQIVFDRNEFEKSKRLDRCRWDYVLAKNTPVWFGEVGNRVMLSPHASVCRQFWHFLHGREGGGEEEEYDKARAEAELDFTFETDPATGERGILFVRKKTPQEKEEEPEEEQEEKEEEKIEFPFSPVHVGTWEEPRHYPFEKTRALPVQPKRFFADTGFRWNTGEGSCQDGNLAFFVFTEQGRYIQVPGPQTCEELVDKMGYTDRRDDYVLTTVKATQDGRDFTVVVMFAKGLRLPYVRRNGILGAVYVAASTIKNAGLGLFARFGFKKNDLIARYEGELQTTRQKDEIQGDYVVDAQGGKLVPNLPENKGRRKGERFRYLSSMDTWDAPGRFANDGCNESDPKKYNDCSRRRNNADFAESADKPYSYWLVANRPIAANEEIFVSYGSAYWKWMAGKRKETFGYFWMDRELEEDEVERVERDVLYRPFQLADPEADASPVGSGLTPEEFEPFDYLYVDLDLFKNEKLMQDPNFWATLYKWMKPRGIVETSREGEFVQTPLFKNLWQNVFVRLTPDQPRA